LILIDGPEISKILDVVDDSDDSNASESSLFSLTKRNPDCVQNENTTCNPDDLPLCILMLGTKE
jgi:hypothetical protein